MRRRSTDWSGEAPPVAGVAASNAIVLVPLTEEDGGDGGDGGGNGGGGGGGDGSGGGPGSGDRRPAPVIVAARPTEKRYRRSQTNRKKIDLFSVGLDLFSVGLAATLVGPLTLIWHSRGCLGLGE